MNQKIETKGLHNHGNALCTNKTDLHFLKPLFCITASFDILKYFNILHQYKVIRLNNTINCRGSIYRAGLKA